MNEISRVVVGEVGSMRAKQSKNLSLVFNRFLLGPVETRGFMGGEHWEGEFIRSSKYRFFTD